MSHLFGPGAAVAAATPALLFGGVSGASACPDATRASGVSPCAVVLASLGPGGGRVRRPMGEGGVGHIKDLLPDPANRRRHNPRNIGMVVDALQQVGAARSIVIDEANVILAGNGVTEAAAEAGITKVRIIEADGNELVAVRRRGLSEAQKRALAIYDNRTSELATWDEGQLAADRHAGLCLQPFWTPEEEAALLSKSGATTGRTCRPSGPRASCGVTYSDWVRIVCSAVIARPPRMSPGCWAPRCRT